MKTPIFSRHNKSSLNRRLFAYMAILALLLVVIFYLGIGFLEKNIAFDQTLYQSLAIYTDTFEQRLSTHYNQILINSLKLSNVSGNLIQQYLEDKEIKFDNSLDKTHLHKIEELLLEPLEGYLLRTDCSGAFIYLNTSAYSASDNAAEESRAGLYIQTTGFDTNFDDVFLYRGYPDLGKEKGILPHRKWRQEFQVDFFPDYEQAIAVTSSLTGKIQLPGVEENVMLLRVPIKDEAGNVYGLCGFEISQNYFKIYHAQLTSFNRLLFLLLPEKPGDLDANEIFSAGVKDGYYLEPEGSLREQTFENDDRLSYFGGDKNSYIGIIRPFDLSYSEQDYRIAVILPQRDYGKQASEVVIRKTIFLGIMFMVAGALSVFFSKRYLAPVIKALSELKKNTKQRKFTSYRELDDLFQLFADKDEEHEIELSELELERQDLVSRMKELEREYLQVQKEYDETKRRLNRLVYDRKKEINPAEYAYYLENVKTLTAQEKRIYESYLEGKSATEIMQNLDIKETTLRYHNRNIYSKLGVRSLKQLLRFASLAAEENKS